MPLSPETNLGPYKIRSLLGSGGMGEVYAAHDTRLDRDVAIKVLREPVALSQDRLRRFEQEARAAAALDHPGILAVHDVGWHEGLPYIVSELLDGETLRERLRAGGFTVHEALEVALPLVRALSAAHEKGIVHRDLKPENVFLTRDRQVKVLDFGLAKLLPTPEPGAGSSIDTASTASGVMPGTAAYMSPEQVRRQETDARSDVFAFGVLLYEMLAGRRPFRGQTAADVMAAILQDDPPRLLDLDVAVSPLLERITDRCLKKRPQDRFQSARDLGIALEAIAGAESAGHAPVSGPMSRRLRRLLRRRRALAAALALLAIGGLATRALQRSWAGAGAGGDVRIGSLAVLPLVNLSGDPEQEYLADGMTEALIADLAKIPGLKVVSRTSAARYKATNKALPAVAHELKVDAVVEGSLLRSGDRVRVTARLIPADTDEELWANTYERGLTDVLALQSDIAGAIAGEMRVQMTPELRARLTTNRTVDPEAYSLYLKGRYHLNIWKREHIEKAVAAFEQATRRDPTFAPGYAGLAEAQAFLVPAHLTRPQEAYPKARANAERALALDSNLPEALAVLGGVRLEYGWDFSGGEDMLRRAVELGPGSLPARLRYSMCLTVLGRFEQAVAAGRRTLELDPVSPAANYHLGRIYFFARRFDESIAQLQTARDLDPEQPIIDALLAGSYAATGRHPEALAACDRYVARRAEADNISCDAAAAWAYAVSGRRSEAIKILEALQRLASERWVDSYQIALIYAGLGDKERAFEWLEKALAEHSGTLIRLKVEVIFGPEMRSDPRYDRLMRRVGFPAP